MLSDSIISESKTEVENLGKVFKIERKKIAYLRNCVDLNIFHTIPRDYCARVLHKEDGKKYILFVGHISRNKGIYDLIDVFKIINNEDPTIHLLIVGFGPDKSDVAKKIEQMGLNNYVSFEGLVLHENLKLYYNLASVFVLPSYSEGMPNVVMEAIACNALTVATTVGDIDSLPDSLLLKIPPGNKALLFQALKKAIDGGFRIDELERSAFLKECSMETHQAGLKRLIGNLSVSLDY
jgi:glycosyltransferase involved in cell wall biosynthesis